jgi:protein involved in polysaccharide export with SLBB domain
MTMFKHRLTTVRSIALAAVWGASVLHAASACAQDAPVYSRTRAVEESRSQAELQAEQMVSLSAEKLISLLRQEAGLLLEVKKSIVRKAFEQGRILDPKDLTDDALFRLLREDENMRILVTQEVTRRLYIRALPTKEDRERELIVLNTLQTKDQAAASVAGAKNEEERFWAFHERRDLVTPPLAEPTQNPASPNNAPNTTLLNQQPPLGPPTIQPQPEYDSRRALEMADMQDFDNVDGLSAGSGSLSSLALLGALSGSSLASSSTMDRISPDDLSGLLRASSGQQMVPNLNGATGQIDGLGPGQLPNIPFSGLPGGDLSTARTMGGVQDQYLQNRRAMVEGARGYMPLLPLKRDDHAPLRHRVNPYADVPSLYDLYSQYGMRSPQLVRFGEDIFRNGTGNLDLLPIDLPAGPDYVLGPGDALTVNLWGSVSQRLRRVVDPEGRISLPESGSVQVAGQSLGDVQKVVQGVLRSQFRDVQADVSLARLRTIRVYVVGDVERAGAYDVSSLSTPLNAVIMAGGPTSQGSLRTLRHYRGNTLVQEMDVYDLLLHGVRNGVERLQSGDTVLVPPLGPEVTVEGMVRRPAIYELRGEKSLSEVLELAGGVLTSGTLRHVDVERIEAHESRTMLRLDMPESNNQESVAKALDDFSVQDGDKIKISPIVPYADKTVYLEGHVSRPGKFAFQQGMLLTDLIKSYNDLLPEPSKTHAEIVRLNPPDYEPQVIAFNLDDALNAKNHPLALKPFDTVRIFSRFDFEDPPLVTVAGEVRDPGDHLTNGVTRVRDAVYLAGGLTSDASTESAQIFRRTGDNKLVVLSVNLKLALSGDEKDNLTLEPKDRLIIHSNLAKVDPPTVTIEGEVGRPGKYPLSQDMTAAELVRTAGGFKRGAYTEAADLTRYEIENGQSVVGEHQTIPIGRAVEGEPDTDMRLRDGDVLTIRQLAGWHDVGATIKVSGEVMHPGTYGIEEGERLSSIIERAGGLRSDAYPFGAIFERVQVRELEERNRAELVRSVEEQGSILKAAPDSDAKPAAIMQWQATMDRLQAVPPAGRMVIHVSKDMKHWRNTSADIQVRAGDSIYVPKVPTSVMVDGAVYHTTAISFKPGKSAGWYLRQAGGPSNTAYKKGIFVIRADGSVIGGSGGMFTGGVESAELRPGDMVVVPEKAFSANTQWKNILEGSQVAYAVGVAIQVARSF